MELTEARVKPPLDESFRPAVLANRNFLGRIKPLGGRLVIGVERSGGEVSRFETFVYPEGHPNFEANFPYIERIVKFLLWQRGGHTVYIGGPRGVAEHIQNVYSVNGARKFDAHFMGLLVYDKEVSVVAWVAEEVPASRETGKLLGRNLNGCRIGFDLGASDRKVSAVVDGIPVYSEEVIWEPRRNSEPGYHYREVMAALRTAASKMPRLDAIGGSSAGKMPRLDAIGGSSAGIYVDNRPMVASLFRGIPQERFGEIKKTTRLLQSRDKDCHNLQHGVLRASEELGVGHNLRHS